MNDAPACEEESVSKMSGLDELEQETDRVRDGRLLGGRLVRERALGRLDSQVVDVELHHE